MIMICASTYLFFVDRVKLWGKIGSYINDDGVLCEDRFIESNRLKSL